MMKRKRLLIFGIIVVAIASLIAVPKTIKNNRIRNEIKPLIESWEEKNGITIKEFSFKKSYSDEYHITIVWDGFEELTPSQMSNLINSWDSDFTYFLDTIISNGNKYSISFSGIFSDKDRSQIVSFRSYSSSNGSSSSSSQKTATCNYCHGTGKVNGEKCPWCNGSGKTYDNAFNDALG